MHGYVIGVNNTVTCNNVINKCQHIYQHSHDTIVSLGYLNSLFSQMLSNSNCPDSNFDLVDFCMTTHALIFSPSDVFALYALGSLFTGYMEVPLVDQSFPTKHLSLKF